MSSTFWPINCCTGADLALAEIQGPDIEFDGPVISCGCRFDGGGTKPSYLGGAAILVLVASIALGVPGRLKGSLRRRT